MCSTLNVSPGAFSTPNAFQLNHSLPVFIQSLVDLCSTLTSLFSLCPPVLLRVFKHFEPKEPLPSQLWWKSGPLNFTRGIICHLFQRRIKQTHQRKKKVKSKLDCYTGQNWDGKLRFLIFASLSSVAPCALQVLLPFEKSEILTTHHVSLSIWAISPPDTSVVASRPSNSWIWHWKDRNSVQL